MKENDQVMDELINLNNKVLELEQKNRLYKETEKTGKVGGWQFDPITMKQTWTDEVFRILEIDLDHGAPEVPKGMEFIDPEFRPLAEKAVQLAMENGEPYNQEWIVTTLKGNKKWVNAVCNPKMKNGKVVAISGSFQDITSKKSIEEELIKSEEKIKLVLDNSPFPIAVVDEKDKNIKFWSKSAIQLFGHNPTTSEEWYELAYPNAEYRQEVIERWKPFLETAQNSAIAVSTGEYEIVCKNGTVKTCEIYAQFIPGSLIVTLNDITKEKKSEEYLKALNQQLAANEQQLRSANQQLQANEQQLMAANEELKASEQQLLASNQQLQASEQQLLASNQQLRAANHKLEATEKQFRNLFNSMQEGVYLHSMVYDDQGKAINYRIIEANPISEKLLNIKTKDAIGNLATDLYGTKEAPFIDIYSRVAETGEPYSFEQYFEPMNKYFLISVFSPIKGDFATAFIDITERKVAENQLLESEKMLLEINKKHSAMIENIGDVIAIVGTEGNTKYQSPNVEKWFGWKPEELHGNAWDKIHPDDVEMVQKEFTKVLESEKTLKVEYRFKCKDGSYKPIKLTAINLTNDPIIDGILLNYHDITERKKAEVEILKTKEKAENSEKYLENIIKNIADPIFVKDEESKLLVVNDAFCQLFMLNKENIIGKTLAEDVSPAERESFLRIDKMVLNTGKENISEEPLTVRGGPTKTISTKKSRFLDEKGRKFLIGIIRDITERKQTEIELLQAKEKADQSNANVTAIIEGTKNSVWAFDMEYCILYINNVFQREFLQSFGVILKPGMSLVDALPEPLQPFWKPRYDRVLANEQFIVEDAVPAESGTIYIEVSFNPIIKDGQVIGGSCFGSNITSRKLAEIELIEAREKAVESDRLKSAFLANMSHEIRTPMNGILGFTNLLHNPNLTGEEQQKFVNIIQKSGNRMLNTVNDIIDISRIESGLVELSVSQVNINEQLKYLHSFFNPEAAEKGIRIIFENDITEKASWVITDLEKFNSIFTNLIKNAIKFTDQGTISLGFNIMKENVPGVVEFYVVDSGIGIPKDRQKAIFDRFIQADIEDKKANQGSGLGLAISKAYVEMLGGKIWVESEVGLGSAFYFTIPYKTVSESKPKINNDGQILSDDNINRKLSILVVEDDEISQQLISIVVEKFAKKIITVTSGLEAVEACRNNPDIDLILMDIRLPDMNGYEATRQIRQFKKDVVIIAQTAFALAGDKEKAISMGCNDYISKPIDKSEFDEIIKKYLMK